MDIFKIIETLDIFKSLLSNHMIVEKTNQVKLEHIH